MAEEKLSSNKESIGEAGILYISSVPVTLLYSGATFMYRLFKGWENELTIFQGNKLSEESQLKNTEYHYYPPLFKRLQNTRFKDLYFLLNFAVNYFFVPPKLKRLVKEKKPKVVITVSHGLLWLLAYRVAKRNNLPLVIVIHDDMNSYYPQKKISGKIIHSLFQKVYKNAQLRFCISGLMKERYDVKYHVSAEVLYPLQGKFSVSKERNLRSADNGLTIAYAGSLDSGPYIDMIINLSKELEKKNGSLIIFTNVFPSRLKAISNIVNHGFLSPDKLEEKLEELADVLFVPFPFYDNDVSVELAFPSKMADYTLIKKPLLIWAPPNCAISGWFRSLDLRIGVLIESLDDKDMSKAIDELLDPINNSNWGKNSYAIGQEYFNNEKQQQFFFSKIRELIA